MTNISEVEGEHQQNCDYGCVRTDLAHTLS